MVKIYVVTLLVYISQMAFAFSQMPVDIESLGLDNVNKQNVLPLKLPIIEIDKVQKVDQKVDDAKKLALPVIEIDNTKKDEKTKVVDEKKPNLEIKGKAPIKDKEDIIDKEDPLKDLKEEKVTQNPDENIIIEKKVVVEDKQKLEESHAMKQKEIDAQEREKSRVENLEELRQKYLLNSKKRILDERIIVPKRKVINPFISEEIPAAPILDMYRTSDNIHIPVFLSLDKRIKNLFDTISYGDVAFFNSAYQDIKNPNIKNELGDTLLTYSLLTQKHAISASIISKGADTNMPNRLGYRPLDIAIELKDLKNFELLIRNKADIHFTDKFGRTYLFHAARIGFLSAVEILVRHDIDINALDKDGFSALDIAYKNKQELIVQFLLKNGAKTWIEKPFDPTNTSLIKKLESRWGDSFNHSQY